MKQSIQYKTDYNTVQLMAILQKDFLEKNGRWTGQFIDRNEFVIRGSVATGRKGFIHGVISQHTDHCIMQMTINYWYQAKWLFLAFLFLPQFFWFSEQLRFLALLIPAVMISVLAILVLIARFNLLGHYETLLRLRKMN